MVNKQKSEIKIALIGAAAGVVFTAIYDWIKNKPLLSTLKNFLGWIWNNIFQATFSVWQILIGIILIFTIRFFAKKINSNETVQTGWLEYTEDVFDNLKWKWRWRKSSFGYWNVYDISPTCNKCGTKMNISGYSSFHANCPRCDNSIDNLKSTDKIEAIILDNVERKLYRK